MSGVANDGSGALLKGAAGAKKLVEQIKAKENDTTKIDSKSERNALAEALSNAKTKEEKAVIQDAINIANGNTTKVAGNNNIVGNTGNVQTGDMIAGNNNKNTIIINNPQPTPPKPPKPPKAKLDPDAVKQGKDLAQQMHDQTSSFVSNNTKVNSALSQVDADNAYTFFSEYAKLARNDDSSFTTGAMHDAHGLTEATMFTTVNNSDTFPALNALIAQAGSLGLGNSVECQRLESLMHQHANDSSMVPTPTRLNPLKSDITAETGREFDIAVRNLLAKMSTKIEP